MSARVAPDSSPRRAGIGHRGREAPAGRPPRDWPNRAASRLIVAAGIRWHVQVMGAGPAVLLLHGTGAATHSWRGLAPLLTERNFTVVAPDLPGHGFTGRLPGRASLPAMAAAVAALLRTLNVAPALAVGHSAGAAILARMALDGTIAPAALVALNGALRPFRGLVGRLFSPFAQLLAHNPLVPWLFARTASDRAVQRLVDETGSRLSPEGVALYARLVRDPAHVAGALAMMADWDLDALNRDLPALPVPLVLVAGARDRTIPPAQADEVRARVPGARIVRMPGVGHLAHEERPREIADLVAALIAGPRPGRTP